MKSYKQQEKARIKKQIKDCINRIMAEIKFAFKDNAYINESNIEREGKKLIELAVEYNDTEMINN